MTWEEFVDKVDAQLKDREIPRSVAIEAIEWRRDFFGGDSIPDIYVNDPDPATDRIVIGED